MTILDRILVTGARDWKYVGVIRRALLSLHPAGDDGRYPTLVHGDCPTGADAIADAVARSAGWFIEKHPADWQQYGKSAGPRRNQEMVDLGADVCLAFIGRNSRGTVHCANAAEAAGIPVTRFYEAEVAGMTTHPHPAMTREPRL